jgi:predicted transcriptional regulator
MKNIKNHPSTDIKIKNQENILKALLTGNKNVHKIEEEANISHQSSCVHLTDLEKRELVMRVPCDNGRFKIYSLTPQGFLKLNQFHL